MPAAQTERPPAASEPTSPPAARPSREWREAPRALARSRLWGGLWWTTLALAAICCFVTFNAKGGLNLEAMTNTEMALTLGSGALIAVCVLLAPQGARAYGAWPVGLLLAFAALSGISIVWSVQPDHSWQDAGRLLAYSAVFAAGVALVRVAPARWPAILGGLALGAVVVCAYALATKVFPASLAPSNTYARLKEPYGYWNAVGLSAAMGVVCCLWLGARRTGHALLRALAYPAMGLLLLTLLLSYSRGALVALAVGLALWFATVPLRLRGATLLIVGALGGGAVAAWDFSTQALSSEGVALAQRTTAGHRLGALIVAVLLALAVVGVAIGFRSSSHPPSLLARRRAGAALLATMALAVVAFAGALALSHRGLAGSVSHAVHDLTDPNAKPPPNTPGRLTAVASVRARYWKEGLQVFAAHPLVGAGAEGYATAHLRYETETLEVRHAHSFIVQTLADLGIAGLLVALALLVAWLAAAGRATHPFNRRWRRAAGARPGALKGTGWRRLPAGTQRRYTPERVAMLSMLSLVVVFGAHSLIDWTWYVPGDACVALLCAGWLAGRGPLTAGLDEEPLADVRPVLAGARPSYTRVAIATATVLAALLAAWSQWQPLRSEEASQEADAHLEAHDTRAALAAADTAVARDPLSIEALFTLASVQRVSGEDARARATLVRAVRLQPSNPQTWLALGRYDLQSAPGEARAALRELQAAVYLDPESVSAEAIAGGNREAIETHNDYVMALQRVEQLQAAASARERAARGVSSAGGTRSPAAGAARPAARRRSARRSP